MIHLRNVQAADEAKILGWRNLPEVSKYMYTEQHIAPEAHAEWFEGIQNDRRRRYWVIGCDENDVGLANIYNIDESNRRCEWAFYIASAGVRGKGVGSFVEYFVMQYVFETLKLNKLCCEVFTFNDPVIKMHKRFGFEQEGLYRQHIFKRGVALDVVALALIRSVWTKKKSVFAERLLAKGLVLPVRG